MSTSLESWQNVWSRTSQHGEYAFKKGRLERAADKLAHLKSIGIEFRENEKVLEAGCGDGAVIISLQKQFGVCGHGADFAVSALDQATRMMVQENTRFYFTLSDICSLPFPEGYFDKIVCLGVVEHMVEPRDPVRELFRVLKPGGTAVIMTPNKISFGRIDRILKQLFGVWHMGFQDEFSPRELSRILKDSGFKKVESQVVLRPGMPNDSWSRKAVSYLDSIFHKYLTSWGFYSYTWAVKD